MAKVQAYASGREVVLWCAHCQQVVARLGGMHTVVYINELTGDHNDNCNGVKTNAEAQSGS